MNTPLTYYPLLDEDYGSATKRAKLNVVEQAIKEKLSTTMLATSPEEADILLIGGGDGFMFRSIRTYHHLGKPFFGLNAGTLGFLLNETHDLASFPTTIDEFQTFAVPIYPVEITDTAGETSTGFRVNDIQIGGHTNTYPSFDVQADTRSKQIQATMLLVNGPVGCTGYGASLGQPLLPLGSNIMGVVGMGALPFRYKALPTQQMHISVSSRDQVDISLDGQCDVRQDISSVIIQPPVETATLAFLKDTDFEARRIYKDEKKYTG